MTLAEELALGRRYGEKTLNALREMSRLSEVGARFAARGREWFDGDPDNAPGLACEGLIIKLGENVSRVSSDFETDHPEVPWRVIKDMRNRLTHYYEATDYEVVWATITGDFPRIRAWAEGLLGRDRVTFGDPKTHVVRES